MFAPLWVMQPGLKPEAWLAGLASGLAGWASGLVGWASGLAGWASGQAGWASGQAGWPKGGGGRMYKLMDGKTHQSTGLCPLGPL